MGEAGRFSATDHRRHPVAAGADVGPIRNERRRPGDARGGRNAPKSTTRGRNARDAFECEVPAGASARAASPSAPRRADRTADQPIHTPPRRRKRIATRDAIATGEETHVGGGFLPPFFLDLLGAMLTDGGGKVEEVWWRLGERALSAEREAGKHSLSRSAGNRAKKYFSGGSAATQRTG